MNRSRAWALRLAGVAVFLLLWEILGRILGEALFAPFSSVIAGFPATVREYVEEYEDRHGITTL